MIDDEAPVVLSDELDFIDFDINGLQIESSDGFFRLRPVEQFDECIAVRMPRSSNTMPCSLKSITDKNQSLV